MRRIGLPVSYRDGFQYFNPNQPVRLSQDPCALHALLEANGEAILGNSRCSVQLPLPSVTIPLFAPGYMEVLPSRPACEV